MLLIREYRVGGNNFFRKLFVQLLKHETSQTTASTTCNRMQENKALERVRAVCLSLDHIDDFLLEFLSLGVSGCPVITSTSSFFGDENIFWVVQVSVGAILNGIDDLNIAGRVLWAPSR